MKRSYLALGFFISAAAAISYFLFSSLSPTNSSVPPAAPPHPPSAAAQLAPEPDRELQQPVRLVVSSLHLEASIEEVGLTPEGNMATPTSNTTLGWYKYGAFPGNPGAAVLATHTGYPSQPTMFRQFETIQKGDTLQIEDKNGTVASFEVYERAIYTPDNAPRQRIFGQTAVARLAVITCTGTWLPNQKTYSHRLIIYAAKSSS